MDSSHAGIEECSPETLEGVSGIRPQLDGTGEGLLNSAPVPPSISANPRRSL